MEYTEIISFQNTFGLVSDKRVLINYKSGQEDIPLHQVTSISMQRKKNTAIAVISFIITLLILIYMFAGIGNLSGIEVLLIIFVSAFGALVSIANWIGHHSITISASGKDRRPIRVEMAKTQEGRAFADAIRKQIIK